MITVSAAPYLADLLHAGLIFLPLGFLDFMLVMRLRFLNYSTPLLSFSSLNEMVTSAKIGSEFILNGAFHMPRLFHSSQLAGMYYHCCCSPEEWTPIDKMTHQWTQYWRHMALRCGICFSDSRAILSLSFFFFLTLLECLLELCFNIGLGTFSQIMESYSISLSLSLYSVETTRRRLKW